MTIFKRLLLLLLLPLALFFVPSSALAGQTGPKWVITSVSDPTNIAPESPSTEVQDVTIHATGGTFTLRTGTLTSFSPQVLNTAPIAYDATPEEVQRAIAETEETVGGAPGEPGNPGVVPLLRVTGSPGAYVITWKADSNLGAIANGLAVAPVTVDGSGLTLPGECVAGTPNSCPGSASVSLASRGENPPQLVLTAINVGGSSTDGEPVTVTDTLPAGFTPVPGNLAHSAGFAAVDGINAFRFQEEEREGIGAQCSSSPVLECTFPNKPVDPGDSLIVTISLAVAGPPTVSEGESVFNRASVSGGGAPQAFVKAPVTISSTPAGFGIVPGSLISAVSSTQAGAHANLTTSFTLNTSVFEQAAGYPKNVEFDAPVGLVGDVVGLPRCSQKIIVETVNGLSNCPTDTRVGIATLAISIDFFGEKKLFSPIVAPVYNIAPTPGEPAAFMFLAEGFAVRLDTSVLSNGDYGVRVTAPHINQGGADVSTAVTIWGVPSEHNGTGSDEDIYDDTFGGPGGGPKVGLLSNPTQCTEPLSAMYLTDSWAEPEVFAEGATPMGTLSGCDSLPFSTSVSMVPDTFQGGAPAGYDFNLSVDRSQDLNPEGNVTSDVKNVSTTLPLGTVISPSAANGLGACKDDPGVEPGQAPNEFGLHSLELASCSIDSQVGTVEITSPDIAEPFGGAVYLAEPECNPCSPKDAENGTMVKLLLQAKGKGEGGVLVKTTGSLSVNQQTGRLTATFENAPQLPFSHLELKLAGGARATLSNPRVCGTATTSVDLTPWSAPYTPDAIDESPFQVTGCQGPQFNPSFSAGTTSNQAGGYSPFTLSFTRNDPEQYLAGIQLKTPPGLLGSLANVPLCPEPQASQGTCSAASEIGTSQVLTGPGAEPFLVTGGRVFLTGPYKGAPFGLSIVVPAKAGPYTLTGTTGAGTVVVRSTISIDPTTSALTVTADPLPTILDGIPLQLKLVDVTIDRPNFIFNPTSCNKLAITGTLSSAEGISEAVSSPFQVTNCEALHFTPKFTVSTSGKTSKANGASLDAKVTYPAGSVGTQANIAKVKVDLPRQLPSRLTTLQKACPAATFDANPANCPAASVIGVVRASTPLLPVQLTGPVYFVSHGGEAFPSLVVVLQGYGVRVDLTAATFISKAGITSSTFNTIPDVPVNSFELYLPEGRYSALAANGNLCTSKLTMPTVFVAQNGAEIHESTPIAVTGCPKAKKAVKKKKKAKKASRARKSSHDLGRKS